MTHHNVIVTPLVSVLRFTDPRDPMVEVLVVLWGPMIDDLEVVLEDLWVQAVTKEEGNDVSHFGIAVHVARFIDAHPTLNSVIPQVGMSDDVHNLSESGSGALLIVIGIVVNRHIELMLVAGKELVSINLSPYLG